MTPRQLLLIRHGSAAWGSPAQEDFDRELRPAGRAAAADLGESLARAGVRLDAIVTSLAPRALETANLVAAAWEPPPPVNHEPRLYEASVPALAGVMAHLDDAWRCVAIVGHNPSLSHFADSLIGEPTVIELVPGALAWLEFPGTDRWAEASASTAVLRELREPRERVIF